jgi:ribonucleoside-diphosphate reductase alpha chain
VLSTSERTQPTLPGVEEQATVTVGIEPSQRPHDLPRSPVAELRDAPYCYSCGNVMQRAGSCFVCSSCGSTSGCS